MSDQQPEFTPVPKPEDVQPTASTSPDIHAIEGVLQSIPEIVGESKKGYKTTEFWLAIGIALATVLDGIPLPEKFEGFVVAGIGVAYVLSRGLAKKGVPVYETSTTVTAPTA